MKIAISWKNQNFEILRLEYVLNTCKYHAKNFFQIFFVILNILKQVLGDLKFWSSRLHLDIEIVLIGEFYMMQYHR